MVKEFNNCGNLLLKSSLKGVFRKEALTPHSLESTSAGTGPYCLEGRKACPVYMWIVTQIVNREAVFLFRIEDVGKNRKFTHLKNSALTCCGVCNWEHDFPDGQKLCSIAG